MRTGSVKPAQAVEQVMEAALSVSSMRTGSVKPAQAVEQVMEAALSVSSMRTGSVKLVVCGVKLAQ